MLLAAADTGFTFGLTLLVQTTILCLAGFAFAILLQRRGAAARSLALRVMLVAMLCAPATSWLLSGTGFRTVGITIPRPEFRSAAFAQPDQSASPLRSMTSTHTTDVTDFGTGMVDALPPLPADATLAARFHRDILISAIGHINMLMVFNTTGMLFLLFTTVWIGWTLARLTHLARYWIMLACVKNQSWDAEPELVGVTRELSKAMDIDNPPLVLRSAMVQTPSIAGLFRPVMLLPESYDATADVLCHELAHCARHDCIWNFLGQVLVALIPFQPLLRWYLRVIEETGDFACDDYVIAHRFDPRNYARQLYECAERLRIYFAMSDVGVKLIPWKSSLRRRVDHILKRRVQRNVAPGGGIVTAAVLVCCVALAFSGIVTVRHSAESLAVVLPDSAQSSDAWEDAPETVPQVQVSSAATTTDIRPEPPVITRSVKRVVEPSDLSPQPTTAYFAPEDTPVIAAHTSLPLPEEDHREHITLDMVIETAAVEMIDALEPDPAAGPAQESPSSRFAKGLDSFEPEIDPTNITDIETCIEIGNELLESGKPLSAREVFLHALVLDPKDFRVNLGLGRSYHNYGNLLLAKMFYKKAILLKPTHAAPHYHLGILLQAQGKPGEAMKEYKIAIDYNPQLARGNGHPI